jgi:hypothetical protein
LKRVISLAPILNVVQLMMARELNWSTVTRPVPAPLTVATPPTTDGPSGPAAAGPAPSASSAAAVKSRWMRGDIAAPFDIDRSG